MTRFDDDTALEPAGEHRWRGQVSERWYVGRGANGGLLAAQAVRAMEALAADVDRVPRSVTIHYLEALTAGPLEIAGTVERSGRSTTSVSLRVAKEGRTAALALGAVAVWREGQRDHLSGQPPEVPRPEELTTIDPAAGGLPAFMANYDWRWLPPGTGAEVGGWIRVPGGGRRIDHVGVAAFADAFPPAVFPLIGWKPAAAPTIDLTIHFRAPLSEVGDGWILSTFRSRRVSGGFFEEDGELWSEDGVLLAQSRQLAMLREHA